MKTLHVFFVIFAFALFAILPAQTHWQGPYRASATVTKKKAKITARANTSATAAARDGYYMCSTSVKGKQGQPDSGYFAQGPASGSSVARGAGQNKNNCFADATTYGYNIGKTQHYYDSHSYPP